MIQPLALPYPRFKIEDGDIKAEGLVSINSPTPLPTDRRIPEENFGKILKLTFDDIPYTTLVKNGVILIGPTREDVENAIAFGLGIRKLYPQDTTILAVHCFAGKSRSAAIALAINLAINPTQIEEVISSLLQYDPNSQMCFNPRIIALADEILQTGGNIDKQLHKLCPPYRSWKRYWENKA